VTSADDIWLTRIQVAERLDVPPKTLAEWASKGTGPPYAKFGRHVRYRLRDLLEWEAAQFVDRDGNAA